MRRRGHDGRAHQRRDAGRRGDRPCDPPGRGGGDQRRGRGLGRARHRAARLRAQERLPLGRARHVRRHRLSRGRRRSPRTPSAASNVYGVSMPSAYSSDHSMSDAADLAERIGAHYRVVPIAPMVDAFVTALDLTGLAEENVQARVRGTTLMALSNAEGHLVLGHGQQERTGGRLLDDLRRRGRRVRPDQGRARRRWSGSWPAGATTLAELARRDGADPAQLDRQAAVGRAAARATRHRLAARLRAAGRDHRPLRRPRRRRRRHRRRRASIRHWSSGSSRLVDGAEWKRRQYPPGPKISCKAFGKDRRLPITNRWRES